MSNKQFYAYLDAKQEFERLDRQIEEIETRIQGLGVDYSKVRVQTTPNHDKLAEAMDELTRLHKEAVDAQAKQVEIMQRVLADIDSIPDATLRDIMQRRYIEGESWDTIAQEKNYSWSHIQTLHRKARDSVKREEGDE